MELCTITQLPFPHILLHIPPHIPSPYPFHRVVASLGRVLMDPKRSLSMITPIGQSTEQTTTLWIKKE